MDYIYKTTPRFVRPDATIRMDDGSIEHTSVTGYVFAFKPYFEERLNKENVRAIRRTGRTCLRETQRRSATLWCSH